MNLVLLLDVSGSMNSPDKLPLAQQSMALLLDSLKPTDTVAIVVYAGAAGMVLAPTPARTKTPSWTRSTRFASGGSTAGAAGIKLAYELAEKNFRKNGVNRILLATDGDFNVGISNEDELKGFVQREREKGVFLSVLGFGVGNYQDQTAQVLAQNGNGTAAYIDSLNEAKKGAGPAGHGLALHDREGCETAGRVQSRDGVGISARRLRDSLAQHRRLQQRQGGCRRRGCWPHGDGDLRDHTGGFRRGTDRERRYAAAQDEKQTSSSRRGKTNEYGFLKVRYKLPNGFRSRLMEQPILVDAGVPAALRKEVEFATAVAGFGQLLRGGEYTGSLKYDDVMREAEDSLGDDAHGYRKEFIELVRRAARMKDDR